MRIGFGSLRRRVVDSQPTQLSNLTRLGMGGGWDDWGRFEEGPIPLQIQIEIQYVDGTVGDCLRNWDWFYCKYKERYKSKYKYDRWMG